MHAHDGRRLVMADDPAEPEELEGGDAAMNPSAAVGRATVFLGQALRV